MVPALIDTVKQAGLVLVSDATGEEAGDVPRDPTRQDSFAMIPEGVNGVLKATGILRFNESIDM